MLLLLCGGCREPDKPWTHEVAGVRLELPSKTWKTVEEAPKTFIEGATPLAHFVAKTDSGEQSCRVEKIVLQSDDWLRFMRDVHSQRGAPYREGLTPQGLNYWDYQDLPQETAFRLLWNSPKQEMFVVEYHGKNDLLALNFLVGADGSEAIEPDPRGAVQFEKAVKLAQLAKWRGPLKSLKIDKVVGGYELEYVSHPRKVKPYAKTHENLAKLLTRCIESPEVLKLTVTYLYRKKTVIEEAEVDLEGLREAVASGQELNAELVGSYYKTKFQSWDKYTESFMGLPRYR